MPRTGGSFSELPGRHEIEARAERYSELNPDGRSNTPGLLRRSITRLRAKLSRRGSGEQPDLTDR